MERILENNIFVMKCTQVNYLHYLQVFLQSKIKHSTYFSNHPNDYGLIIISKIISNYISYLDSARGKASLVRGIFPNICSGKIKPVTYKN